MEAPSTVEYQSSQVNLFMAGITKDLEDHVTNKSAKYCFNFDSEKPARDPEGDFEWFEVSNFSKSEVNGKKPRINVYNDRKSTADTDMLSARGPVNTSMFSFDNTQGAGLNGSRPSMGAYPRHSLFEQQRVDAQRFAVIRPDFADSNFCIPEEHERESNPSPSQDVDEFCGRESLAERPEAEGSIQNPSLMHVSSPFAVV